MAKRAVACVLLSCMSVASVAHAADMTFERALNVGNEPQNWLLHHGNYQGYRFSTLDQINTDTVKHLHVAFTVGLGGTEGSGSRYKFGKSLKRRRSSRTA